MLEMLLAKNKVSLALKDLSVKAPGSAGRIALVNARNMFALAIDVTWITVFGGTSGNFGNNGNDPYPATGYRQAHGIVASNIISQGSNSYTWARGCQVGSFMYIADGHTGAFVNWFRRVKSNGDELVSMAPTIGENRVGSVLVNVNDTDIFRCGGIAGTTVTRHASMYSIASNGWKELAPSPIPVCGSNGMYYKGKVYVLFGSTTMYGDYVNTMQIYDVATNTWTVSKPAPSEFVPASGIAYGSGCIIDGVIWYFTSSLVKNGVPLKNLGLIKYFIDANRYEFFITPYTERYQFEVAIHPTNKTIHVVGGHPTVFTADASHETVARVNEMLIFASS